MRIQTYPIPPCPECGAMMKLRRPRANQGWEPFWGCSRWPDCRGTRQIQADGTPEGLGEDFSQADLDELAQFVNV